jgi:hypothetical protein
VLPPKVYRVVGDRLSLRLENGMLIENAVVTSASHSWGKAESAARIAGYINRPAVHELVRTAEYVLFLVPNLGELLGKPIAYRQGLSYLGRIKLTCPKWIVTLDAVEKFSELKNILEDKSGFAITHVGRLQSVDGRSFTRQEAQIVLDALFWLLTFASGRWTGPCLQFAHNLNGNLAWVVWDDLRVAPFLFRLSCVDSHHPEQIENTWPGFLNRWSDENWQDVIRNAIHWYVEANDQAGSIEGSIVLTQTAFELLASAVLVENYAWLSSQGYEALRAEDRVRLLFRWVGIPLEIPPQLPGLSRLAKSDNLADIAAAMTAIRNTITHPTRKNRDTFKRHSDDARTEAWNLGLWCLELCLLRLLGYSGTYANRLSQRFVGEIEIVPWAVTKS